jgi:hypothetical protein
MFGKNTINLVLEQKYLIFLPAHHIKSAYCSSNVTGLKASLNRYSKKGITNPVGKHQLKPSVLIKRFVKCNLKIVHTLVPKTKCKLDSYANIYLTCRHEQFCNSFECNLFLWFFKSCWVLLITQQT